MNHLPKSLLFEIGLHLPGIDLLSFFSTGQKILLPGPKQLFLADQYNMSFPVHFYPMLIVISKMFTSQNCDVGF